MIKTLVISFIIAFASIILLTACSQKQKPLVVFLVRHAEKVDQSADPELSEAGIKRAATLADVLRSAEIDYIHSSNFIRTRDTAAPTAAVLGLETSIYNHQNLKTFAAELIETGGRHLVVGHSNTTPEMVAILGGDPGSKIDEKDEYDRLYIVTIADNGSVNTVLMRYSKVFQPDYE